MKYAPIFYLLFLVCSSSFAAVQKSLSIISVGNSITLTGPVPSLGWSGNWGMAATSAANDYVGNLAALFPAQFSVTSRRLSFAIYQKTNADLDLNIKKLNLNRYSDILIVQLGDNVNDKLGGVTVFESSFRKILQAGRPNKRLTICLSTWWEREDVNDIIKVACKDYGGIYVYISDIYKDPINSHNNSQFFSNSSVAKHPSDKGMRAIAERIYYAIPQDIKMTMDAPIKKRVTYKKPHTNP